MRRSGWAIAVGLAGCYSGHSAAPYVLVIDDAVLSPTNHDGKSWCTSGDPDVYVAATAGGVTATTDVVRGLMPVWHTPLLVGGGRELASGTLVDVIGSCPGDAPAGATPPLFRVGAALLHPSGATLARGGVELDAIGGVQSLRLRFARGYGYGYGYGYGGYGYGYSDAVYYPYPVTDDGSGWAADDGEPDPGYDLPAPDGDPCGCSGGAGDPTAGDPSADPSGDPGAVDPGGDPGGESLPLRRVPHRSRPSSARVPRSR